MLNNHNQIIFINEYPNLYGGTEYYIFEMASALQKKGIETILLYLGDHHPDEKMNSAFDKLFPIIDLEKQLSAFPNGVIYLNNYRSPKVVKEILKAPNLKFRFIHDHYLSCPRSSKTNPISNNTCTKKVGFACYTCPGVVSRHNKKFVFRTPKQTRAELKLHNEFDGVIVSSLYLHREMVRNGLRSKKIFINPIYQEQDESSSQSEVNPKSKNKKHLMFIGSLIKGKGVDTLIDALAKSKHTFHLSIIGEGAKKEEWEQLASNTPMKSTISFEGRLDKDSVVEYYKKSSAVIVPSTLPETFSKAGADGLRYGTLPICFDVGGISSWLKHEKNGVLTEQNTPEKLAEALDKLGNGKYDSIIKSIKTAPSKLPSLEEHVARFLDTVELEMKRKIKPPKYSYAENNTFIKTMDDTCELFKKVVFNHLDKEEVNSILLIGGYGRGEGGIVLKNDVPTPHNNLDFQIILNRIRIGNIWDKRKLILDELEQRKLNNDITLDFSFNTKFKIKHGTPQLVYYDMKYGHRLVYGDDRWLLGIKRYHSQNISLHDIRELLINRGTLLILNKKILEKEKLNTKEKKIIVKHLVKAIIGYGDALLYLHGKYHWSYKRKKELMWSIAPEYKTFSKIYDYAVNFRFNPHYDRILNADLHLLQNFILKSLEEIHLHFEQSLDKKINNNWSNYFHIFSRTPLHSKKKNLINISKLIYKSFFKKDILLCAELQSSKAFRCKMIGDQGILTAIFPFVLYNPNRENILSNFDDSALTNIYIKVWGKSNDENFDQSLPGKLFSKEKQAA